MYTMGQIQHRLSFFGRTIWDEGAGAMFMNWTGSGFEMVFEAKRVEVSFLAIETVFEPEGVLWPCISVFLDDREKPLAEILLDREAQCCTLFESASPEKHRLRVIKRSENDKGKVGVAGIRVEGELLPIETPAKKLCLEFIGDSITCGFGNEAQNRDCGFLTKEENGLKAYGAVAAALLNAHYYNISVSGISLCQPMEPDFSLKVPGHPELSVKMKAMEDYYGFTDRLHEEARGKKDGFAEWDFSKHKPDAIVVNLGTNDSYRIKASRYKLMEIVHFEQRYRAFIHKLRQLNGERAVICCTMGSMDYYLYDNIVDVVRSYKAQTKDERIFCYKFGGIFPIEEGYGAGDHPSVITHQRMGEELAATLRQWIA